MEDIYAQLADIDKSMLMIDDYDHAIVRDPKRDEVFKTIGKFIDRLANSEGEHEWSCGKDLRNAAPHPRRGRAR